MNVIAKISLYLERSVVTLKLRKEYLIQWYAIHQSYSG